MKNRKAARQAIAGLLSTEITTFQAVYDHSIIDPGGLSPIATLESDGTGPARTFDPVTRQQALIITLYWLWTDTTENSLDDLSDDVLDVIDANPENAGVWSALGVDDAFTQTGFDEPEPGVVYRFERIRVIVE